MSTFSVAIPASPFLMQRMAGLSGVARCVILADLEGASRIFIAGPEAVPPDWEASFRTRERPLPEVIRIDRIEDIAAVPGEQLAVLSGNCLPTRAGMQQLRADPGEPLADGAHCYPQAEPAKVTWEILQASMKPSEGWFGRNINRPISFRISAFLMRWDVSPNAISWFTLALGLAMAAILAHGGLVWLAAGGLLFQAVSVIDCIDGDIARVTFRTSRRGAALDTAFDMIANLGFVVGLLAGLARTYGAGQLYIAGAFLGVAVVCIALMSVLVRLGPKHGSFDVLRNAIALKLATRPRLQKTVLLAERLFKRDFYALFAATMCVTGLAWTLPQFGLLGVVIWLLAILWCAPAIVSDKEGALLPAHLKAL